MHRNIIWVESIEGDLINIHTITSIEIQTTMQNEFRSIIIYTNRDVYHDILNIPKDGEKVLITKKEMKFGIEDALFLQTECALAISLWENSILLAKTLSEIVWEAWDKEKMTNR